MSFTAENVKDLREKTGAGMMDCKKALQETNGNMDEAIEFLRKKGLQSLQKKGDRIATDGLICVATKGNLVSMVELNCETDFVAKNEDFKSFAGFVADYVVNQKPASPDEVLQATVQGEKVIDKLNLLVSKIGEKISLRRFVILEAGQGEKVGSYIHLGNKIGVIMQLKGDATDQIVKDVAMHTAAMNPGYLNPSEIPQGVLDKEKEIYLAQLKDSGKPADILEKIVQGKVAKFSTEVCLNEQIFIKDPTGKQKVKDFLKASGCEIVGFKRFQVGEGMEKKQEDFASEVAKMLS